jgi:hypothetical protein
MSRSTSTDLHVLIHALTQAEKRYVKLFLRRHASDAVPQTVALFDAVAAMPTYDEALLKQRHANEPFIQRLSVAKRELLHLILRAMRLYHDDANREARLVSLYVDARFLRDRGLGLLSKRFYDEAVALADELNDHAMKARLRIDQRYLNATLGIIPEAAADPRIDDLPEIARAIDDHGFFHGISLRLHTAIRIYGTSNAPQLRAIADELHRLALERGEPKTTDSRVLWLRFLSSKAFFVDHDAATAAGYDLERLRRYDDDPRWREERMTPYAALLSSTTIRLLQSHRHDEAFELIDRLRTIRRFDLHRLTPANRREVNTTWVNMELLAAVVTMRFDDVMASMDDVTSVLRDMDTTDYDSPVRIAAHINLALVRWFHRQFDEALHHIDIITGFPPTVRIDMQVAARLLRICIFYETDDHDRAENLIRTERRKGAQSDVPRPADEELFLQTFSKLLQARSRRAIQRILQEAAEAYQLMEQGRPSNLTTNIIGFRHWLDAQLSGTSVVAAARAYYANGAPGKGPDAP